MSMVGTTKNSMASGALIKKTFLFAVLILGIIAGIYSLNSIKNRTKETENLIQEEAERFGKLQSELSELERKNDELAKRRLAILQYEANNVQPVVIIKDKGAVPNKLGRDRLESKQDHVEEELGQDDVAPEQNVLIPEQKDDAEDDGRERSNDVIKEDTQETAAPTIGVVVIACNRPSVGRALDLLLKYRPSAQQFPIVVSQDCGHVETAEVISRYGDKVTHIKPDLSEIHPGNLGGYYKISRHFKWALTQMFEVMNYNYVVIVEDDLDIASDFFSYMSSLRPLLDEDPTVWCVSAWNDNGKKEFIYTSANKLLYRSDFFPGLGWMLSKELWKELSPKWPQGFWDDWMRDPAQRKGRVCIRPEISRTHTFGQQGVSMGQFYLQHLQYNVLNTDPVDFSKEDLSYLKKDRYDSVYLQKVAQCPILTVDQVMKGQWGGAKEAQVQYGRSGEFTSMARRFKVMDDLKAGVPRTAYHGIVSFMYNGLRVHLSPAPSWTGYG
ncbi:alpha-1,3-mannosyl-glycoprotein 2-beta-N-acetylglucosaminyltransferase-like isoform X2 [Dysidea avara]|uniref:alpha-1,3-mannosyl-glycoprotein 2-beta-N-acetylglucosaminyltransferase-like isoform X2 n=1 Tax=Dysidea avara TaxID=196820 RepID=UPI00332DCD5B